MTDFHDVLFPLEISLGSEGGPMRRTDIVTLNSGREERNSPWAGSRRRFNAGYGVKSLRDIETLIAFFEARRGRLHGFRFRDPFDHASAAFGEAISAHDQQLGVGDGETTVFQLVKTYTSGAQSYTRTISHPVAGSVILAINGASTVNFNLDATSGKVTFDTPPALGSEISAGFMFDTPVRFDRDELSINLTSFQAGDIPSVPLIEVLL